MEEVLEEAINMDVEGGGTFAKIASIGEAFSPKSIHGVALQAGAGFLVTSAATKIFAEVFSFALSQGASFNAQALALKQIKFQLEELNKKVDKILNEPLKTATKSLKHAMNYLEDKDSYKNAYLEYEKVLENAGRGFEYVEDLETKVICKRLVIFARFMCNTYKAEENDFIPLKSLQESKKKVIAGAMKIDIDEILEEFEKTPVSKRKRFLRKGGEEQQKLQDTIDSLLKLCLPVIWHFLPDDMLDVDLKNKALLRYVPEGYRDAAKITTKDNILIFVWKERMEENNFVLHWSTSVDNIETILDQNSSPKCFTIENVGEKRFYFDGNDQPLNIKGITYPKMDVYLSNEINSPLFMWKEEDEIKASFGDTFNVILGSKESLDILKYAPSFIKHECFDKFGDLMLHKICEKGLHEYVPYFTNNKASLSEDSDGLTPLHLACLSNDLQTVKEAMRFEGHVAVGLRTKTGQYPIDLTANDEIKTFLKLFARSRSSSLSKWKGKAKSIK